MRSSMQCLSGMALGAFLTACGGGPDEGSTPLSADDYVTNVQAWRDKHEADYRRDFVSIAGLHFLGPGTHTIGSSTASDIVLPESVPPVVGRLTVGDGRVRFEPEPGVDVVQQRSPGARSRCARTCCR